MPLHGQGPLRKKPRVLDNAGLPQDASGGNVEQDAADEEEKKRARAARFRKLRRNRADGRSDEALASETQGPGIGFRPETNAAVDETASVAKVGEATGKVTGLKNEVKEGNKVCKKRIVLNLNRKQDERTQPRVKFSLTRDAPKPLHASKDFVDGLTTSQMLDLPSSISSSSRPATTSVGSEDVGVQSLDELMDRIEKQSKQQVKRVSSRLKMKAAKSDALYLVEQNTRDALQPDLRLEDGPLQLPSATASAALDGGADDSSATAAQAIEEEEGAVEIFLDQSRELESLKDSRGYFDLLAEAGLKRDLKPVDHSKIDYLAIAKELYTVPREIARMSDLEICAFCSTHGDIKMNGKNPVRPLQLFSQSGLSDVLLQKLQSRDIEKPTPIQMAALPALMSGRNVIGLAQTGSGKTLAYLLPLLRHVLAQPIRLRRRENGPMALILAPTRELALQIGAVSRDIGGCVGLKTAVLYGGGAVGPQLSDMKRGAEIVVGTPGRIVDILLINGGRLMNLTRVTFVVLDEGDRLYDLGFGPQIERLLANIRPDRQIALFSATFPKHIQKMVKDNIYRPLELQVGTIGTVAESVKQIVKVFPSNATLAPGAPASIGDHGLGAKLKYLLYLLGEWHDHGESVLVFVSKLETLSFLMLELKKFGYKSVAFHGDQDQEERELALQDIRDRSCLIMLATSLASRGLDLKSVVLVVNFDAPDHLEDYIHRVGRTGRVGAPGTAYTFLVDPLDAPAAHFVAAALEQSNNPVPLELQGLSAKFAAESTSLKKEERRGLRGKGFKFTLSEKSGRQEEQDQVRREVTGIANQEAVEIAAAGAGISGGSEGGAALAEESMRDFDDAAAKDVVGSQEGIHETGPSHESGVTAGVSGGVSGVVGGVSAAELEISRNAERMVDKWTETIRDPLHRQQQREALLPTITGLLKTDPGMHGAGSASNAALLVRPDVADMVAAALRPLQLETRGKAGKAGDTALSKEQARKQQIQRLLLQHARKREEATIPLSVPAPPTAQSNFNAVPPTSETLAMVAVPPASSRNSSIVAHPAQGVRSSDGGTGSRVGAPGAKDRRIARAALFSAVEAVAEGTNKFNLKDCQDPETGSYLAYVLCNDYPSGARARACNRDLLLRLSEATGSVIQLKGIYIDPKVKAARRQRRLKFERLSRQGESASADLSFSQDPGLYVEIVAPTLVAAVRCKSEITNLLEETAKKYLNAI